MKLKSLGFMDGHNSDGIQIIGNHTGHDVDLIIARTTHEHFRVAYPGPTPVGDAGHTTMDDVRIVRGAPVHPGSIRHATAGA